MNSGPEDETTSNRRPQEPEPPYEEVTLADLVVTIYDHRKAAAAVFLGILVLTLGVTAFQEATAPDPQPQPAPGQGDPSANETEPEPVPRYRASATVVLLHEQGASLWALRSPSLAADVASSTGLVTASMNASEEEATVQRLRENTTVTSEGADGWTFATVKVVWTDPQQAADLADAHVDALEDRRPLLENLTWARLWGSFFREAGSENRTVEEQEAVARDRLSTYVAGLTYVRVVEPASAPADPIPPSGDGDAGPSPDDGEGDRDSGDAGTQDPQDPGPDWTLNLALGATLGLVAAFLTPFVLEAAANVREELRERRGP